MASFIPKSIIFLNRRFSSRGQWLCRMCGSDSWPWCDGKKQVLGILQAKLQICAQARKFFQGGFGCLSEKGAGLFSGGGG